MQSTLFFHCRLSALGIFSALTLSVASAAEPTSSAASADTGASGAMLEEITVTAQKRSENLQDVPISVEAFRAEALDAAAISTTADLDVVTPGLETGSEFGWAQPHLRGIGTISVDPGVESPVAMYVDGVYYSSLAGGVLALNNVEQIEVDKGPQGTLFGRNATGGLLQITTKDPTQNFSGQVGLTYGNYNTGGGSVYISGGITPSIAADVAVYVNDQGTGYGTNYFTGIEVNKTSENAIRSKWIFNAPDNTEIKLILDYEQTNFSPVALPAPGTTPLGGSPYTASPQGLDGYYQPYGLAKQGGASVQVKHDFDFGTFSSLTAYRDQSFRTIFDGALVPNFDYALNIDVAEPVSQWSQEFQLTAPTESRLKWVAGIYLFAADAQFDPVSIYGGLLAPLAFDNTYSNQKTYSAAAYAQATQDIGWNTDLTIGLRDTYEERKIVENNYIGLGEGVTELTAADNEQTSVQRPTWRFALDHKFTPDLMGYVSYNRGFKSGGFNDDVVPTTKFAPETLDAFEVGFKSNLFNDRIRINTAAFYYDYKNLQAVRYPDGLEEVYNAVAAKLYGLDLDTDFAVTKQLTIRAGLEALHTQYTNFPNADFTTPAIGGGTNFGVFNADGRALSLAPNFTGDVSVDYAVPTSVGKVNLSVAYADNSGWFAEPDNRLHQSAYSLVNAQAAITSLDSLWTFKVWSRNLSNSQYTTQLSSQSNGDSAEFAPPRTYGVTIERRL
jgi:iron complex outermembrane recepter protein